MEGSAWWAPPARPLPVLEDGPCLTKHLLLESEKGEAIREQQWFVLGAVGQATLSLGWGCALLGCLLWF